MIQISTTSGRLVATQAGGLIHARGIPYATASRFQAPKPLHASRTVRDATHRGPVCPQDRSRLDTVTGPIIDGLRQSESCLVLSVTTPDGARDLPVMVWFHGGAYLSGGGEAPKYDADELAREGVVVVRVSYRLGVLGYLAPRGSGLDNLGLLDQIEALRWVFSNIKEFGGNPNKVTIFGQSAGGDSVLCLIVSDSARGLFQRAIVQSAPLGLRDGRERMTEALRTKLMEELPNPRAASTGDIIAAQQEVVKAARAFGVHGAFPFSPIVGAGPMPRHFDAALASAAGRVELLIGYARDDAAPFLAMHASAAWLNKLGPAGRLAMRIAARIMTAKIFGTNKFVACWSKGGGRIATFRFDWSPYGVCAGAGHCIDLPFVFGEAWSDAPMLAGQKIPEELARTVRRTWADFARGGIAALASHKLRFTQATSGKNWRASHQ